MGRIWRLVSLLVGGAEDGLGLRVGSHADRGGVGSGFHGGGLLCEGKGEACQGMKSGVSVVGEGVWRGIGREECFWS